MTLKMNKKALIYFGCRWTDGPTDQPTNQQVAYRVAYKRLKIARNMAKKIHNLFL